MFWSKKPVFQLETERLYLRLPVARDFEEWCACRRKDADFLRIWEPEWSDSHFTKTRFHQRIYWAKRAKEQDSALALFLIRKDDSRLLGGINLENIQRGPAQSATIGYWIGSDYSRQGLMTEAVRGVVNYAFARLDLSRIQAATLPGNKPSRAVLEKTGFKYEGVAQKYLQINGRWRTHVLYANLRGDRLGETLAGVE